MDGQRIDGLLTQLGNPETTFVSAEFIPISPTCEMCCEPDNGHQWVRQNTAYPDDWDNWVCLCPECERHVDELWQEDWDEYYSGLL